MDEVAAVGGAGARARRARGALRSTLWSTYPELVYRPEVEPIATASVEDGTLMGSGDGVAAGPALSGTVRWSLFQNAGPRLCTTRMIGEIVTEEGRLSGLTTADSPSEPKRVTDRCG